MAAFLYAGRFDAYGTYTEMNKVTAESCERDSAVTLFGPGDYCALTHFQNDRISGL